MIKLSLSKIDLFTECPRCFWLDVKQGIKRPPPAPYTINNAIDYLLKQEFDIHRENGTRHPIMEENKIDAVPYQAPEMGKWRHNFTGVQHEHTSTGFLVFGAVDDIWVDPKGELIIVDYKATGAREHQIYDSYRRQMEIYQWLVRQNGYQVSPFGYFVFARVNKGNGFSANNKKEEHGGDLHFDLFVESYKGDDTWIPDALTRAKKTYDQKNPPSASPNCIYCEYRRGAGEVLTNEDLIKAQS
jgi:hypothetical protein